MNPITWLTHGSGENQMKKMIQIAIAALMLAGIFAGASTSSKAASGTLQPTKNITPFPCHGCL